MLRFERKKQLYKAIIIQQKINKKKIKQLPTPLHTQTHSLKFIYINSFSKLRYHDIMSGFQNCYGPMTTMYLSIFPRLSATEFTVNVSVPPL